MFRFDTRNLLFLFIILAIFNFSRGGFDLESTLLMLPGLILALTFHEYAHAKTADRLGDPTPENQGRLTLNPLAHMDPVGTLCLLFAGFGWGKPVQVNGSYFRNPAKDNMLVALAGPVMNFILAIVLLIIYAVLIKFLPATVLASIIVTMVFDAVLLNVSLGLFNLIPVPPLDGSKIFAYFLKGKAREFLYTLEQYSSIIILVLFITELPSYFITPVLNKVAEFMIALLV